MQLHEIDSLAYLPRVRNAKLQKLVAVANSSCVASQHLTASSEKDLPIVTTNIALALATFRRPDKLHIKVTAFCTISSELFDHDFHNPNCIQGTIPSPCNSNQQNNKKSDAWADSTKHSENSCFCTDVLPKHIFWQLLDNVAHVVKEYHVPLKHHSFIQRSTCNIVTKLYQRTWHGHTSLHDDISDLGPNATWTWTVVE